MPLLKTIIGLLVGILLIGCQLNPITSPQPSDSNPASNRNQLAYIGGDGNVYVTTASRESTIAITDDATTFAEGNGYSYHRIAWSPDGALAFAAVNRVDNSFASKLFTVDSPGQRPRLIAQSDNRFVIYLHWSPVNCPAQPDCRQLAYLIEEDDGIALRIITMVGEQIENTLAGSGVPFYFAWAADGQQMLWHTGGAQRFNDIALLRLYHVEADQNQTLPHNTGLFFAPAWSPQDNRWLAVTADESTDQLQLFEENTVTTLATATNGQIVFVWSPDGRHIAYARRETPDPVFGPIHIYDVNTKETQIITKPSFQISSFFWSPDGQQLAYLSKLLPDVNQFQWRVHHLPSGNDRGFAIFRPSFQMGLMIGSFNQYALSHQLWSPDSRYLVYADRDDKRVERVWLIDTQSQNSNEPQLVSKGSIGVWAWN